MQDHAEAESDAERPNVVVCVTGAPSSEVVVRAGLDLAARMGATTSR